MRMSEFTEQVAFYMTYLLLAAVASFVFFVVGSYLAMQPPLPPLHNYCVNGPVGIEAGAAPKMPEGSWAPQRVLGDGSGFCTPTVSFPSDTFVSKGSR